MPLPDLNEEKSDDYYFGADRRLIENEDQEINSMSSEDPLVKDESPFYANQLEDPEIYQMYFDSIYGDD